MHVSNEAELSLFDIVAVLKAWKWGIVVVVTVCTLAAAIAAHFAPKKYAGVVLISPVSNAANSGLLSGLNSMVTQFGGLASLAGLSQNQDSTKAESLAVLESQALTEQYIKDKNLLPILYADDWDAKNKRWRESDPKKIPTLWQANVFFGKKVRKVAADAKSGLVTVTITWKNPELAAEWANDLVRLTNEYQRTKAIAETERNIAYLTNEVVKTDVLGVKQAIYTVLQSEISKSMLARGNDEYALKIVDPALPPERPSSPQPLLWTFLGFISSTALCLGAAFFKAALGRKPPHQSGINP